MIHSMTGYSRVEAKEGGLSLSVSIKSINHRFLDLQVRLPGALESLEPLLRRLVKQQLARGHVEVTVGLEQPGHLQLQVNRDMLAAYVAAYQTLRKEFGSSSDPDLIALLRVPGMVAASNAAMSPEELAPIQQLLESAVQQALKRLDEMRTQEGETLERDLRARLARLEVLGGDIQKLSQGVPLIYGQRLESRVRELAGRMEIDASRLAQEVAYLASRADITEELTRFRSHLEQATRLLQESSEVGKKLDFLLQEMNREANTLLSKTTDVPEVGLEIARQAIEMKTEIEKLREQAQNIE
jgi:uncharacterized protein (TIGR00255 family)